MEHSRALDQIEDLTNERDKLKVEKSLPDF